MLNSNLSSNKVSKLVSSVILVTSFGLLSGISSLAWSQSDLSGDAPRMREKGVTLEFGGGLAGKGISTSLDLGYKVNQNLGFGVNGNMIYEMLGGITVLSFYAKGILPFDNGFSLYAKTGPGYASHWNVFSSNDGDVNAFAWTLGLGANYYITEGFYIGIEGGLAVFKDQSNNNGIISKRTITAKNGNFNIGYIF